MDCDLLHNPLDQEIPFADIDPDDPLPLTVIAEGMPIVSEKLDVAETRFLKETGFPYHYHHQAKSRVGWGGCQKYLRQAKLETIRRNTQGEDDANPQ